MSNYPYYPYDPYLWSYPNDYHPYYSYHPLQFYHHEPQFREGNSSLKHEPNQPVKIEPINNMNGDEGLELQKNQFHQSLKMEQSEGEQSNERNVKKFKTIRKQRKGKKKTPKPKKRRIVFQKEGRNKNSNLYRSFLKLLLHEGFWERLKQIFQRLKNFHRIKFSFNDFLQKLRQKCPSLNTYINKEEFKSLYFGTTNFHKTIRILFHKFRHLDGFTHILTFNWRSRMKSQNIKQFMATLRVIKNKKDD